MNVNGENPAASDDTQLNNQNQTVINDPTGINLFVRLPSKEGDLPPPPLPNPTGITGSSTQSLEARFELMSQNVMALQQAFTQMMTFMSTAYPQFQAAAVAANPARASPPMAPVHAASQSNTTTELQGPPLVATNASPAAPPMPTASFLFGGTHSQVNPLVPKSPRAQGPRNVTPTLQHPQVTNMEDAIEAIIEARFAQAKEAESKRLSLLEENVRAVQGGKSYSLAGFDHMPDVQLPPKFKMPDFTKYEGMGDPRLHVSSFLGKMSIYPRDEQLLIATFRESLVGPALKWYLSLDVSGFVDFRELSASFLQKYSFNIDMAPSISDVRKMQKRKNETVKEFATRWMLKAAQIEPTPLDRDLVEKLIKLLPSGYYVHLFSYFGSSFSDFVVAVEKVEDAAQEGLLVLTVEERRTPFGRGKGKMDEVHATFLELPRAPKQYKPTGNNHSVKNQRIDQDTNQRIAPTPNQGQGQMEAFFMEPDGSGVSNDTRSSLMHYLPIAPQPELQLGQPLSSLCMAQKLLSQSRLRPPLLKFQVTSIERKKALDQANDKDALQEGEHLITSFPPN